jgi:glycosyltransferase involved in cell wall biosynthesis
MSMYDAFREAVESVLEQSYGDVELVVVVDGTDAVYERLLQEYADHPDVVAHCNESNRGLAASRNEGARLATGDVVAFMDDDAIADENWVAELVAAYEDHDAVAVGGKMTPAWVAGRPRWLPQEFYWLVGVTQRGFADGPGEVRNTFGSNISCRRDVFLELDGFDESIGLKGASQLQAEEPEFGTRLHAETGEWMWYTPDAEVAHKVFEHRTRLDWLAQRAFWQGYSKRAMEDLTPDAGGTERAFLGRLLGEFVPQRLRGLVRSPAIEKVTQLAALFVFTGIVGLGYCYGIVTWDDGE